MSLLGIYFGEISAQHVLSRDILEKTGVTLPQYKGTTRQYALSKSRNRPHDAAFRLHNCIIRLNNFIPSKNRRLRSFSWIITIFSHVYFHAELNAKKRVEIYRTNQDIVMRQTRSIRSSLIDFASLDQQRMFPGTKRVNFLFACSRPTFIFPRYLTWITNKKLIENSGEKILITLSREKLVQECIYG